MSSALSLMYTALLRVVVVAALAGAFVGLFGGWAAAFASAALVILLGFAYHAWKL